MSEYWITILQYLHHQLKVGFTMHSSMKYFCWTTIGQLNILNRKKSEISGISKMIPTILFHSKCPRWVLRWGRRGDVDMTPFPKVSRNQDGDADGWQQKMVEEPKIQSKDPGGPTQPCKTITHLIHKKGPFGYIYIKLLLYSVHFTFSLMNSS